MSAGNVLVVTGSRSLDHDSEDGELVRWAVASAIERHHITHIYVGDAEGVDAEVRKAWCGVTMVTTKNGRYAPGLHVCAADWDRHGKAAGPRRNAEMIAHALAFGKAAPGFVIGYAFPGPKSKGTWDCIRKMVAAKIEVMVIGVST